LRERSGVNLDPTPLRSPFPLFVADKGKGTAIAPLTPDMPKLLLNLNETLTRERPGAVRLTAGIAFDPPLVGAKRKRVDDVAAEPPFAVLEGRVRSDAANQMTLPALPNERRAVAELRQGKLERLERRDPVAPVQSCLELTETRRA